MSSQQTNITITINHLNSLLNGVILAQKRGVYSFEESGILAEPVKVVSQFIKVHNENEAKQKQEQSKLEQEQAKLEQEKLTKTQNTNIKIPSTIQEEDLTLKYKK